ncbi:MAG: hypothetical protein ACK4GT_17875 [Pararhodobacter sp.]
MQIGATAQSVVAPSHQVAGQHPEAAKDTTMPIHKFTSVEATLERTPGQDGRIVTMQKRDKVSVLSHDDDVMTSYVT